MKKVLMSAGFAMAIALGGAVAQASSVLASPDHSNSAANGYYNGSSGNPQDGFTVVTGTGGIELGLRARIRSGGSITPTGIVYTVQPGISSGTAATWNYDFSVDLQPNNGQPNSGLTLRDVITTLTVTGPSGTNSVPLSHWTDNSGYGTGGKDNPATLTDWGVQNSENLGFSDSPLTGFDPNQAGLYVFTLTVQSVTGATLATDTIDVTVAPLPSAAGMGLAMLGLGCGTMLLRKKASIV